MVEIEVFILDDVFFVGFCVFCSFSNFMEICVCGIGFDGGVVVSEVDLFSVYIF